MKKYLLLSSAIATTLLAAPLAHAEAEVGKPAPAFSLPGADGKTYSLDDVKGKIVVLEWSNPLCPFVQKFYNDGHMQKLQKNVTDEGVIWFRINSGAPGKQGHQTPEQTAAYVKNNKVAATANLLDPEGKVGKAYGAKTTPHLYIINEEGVLVYNGAIDDKPTPKASDIEKAKNYVTEALKEIKAGKPVSTPTSKPYGCSVKYAD